MEKAKQVLNKTDIAVLVVDKTVSLTGIDKEMIHLFEEREVPYIVAYNKADLTEDRKDREEHEISVSVLKKEGIFELKEKIAHLVRVDNSRFRIVGDLIQPMDIVVFGNSH